MKKILPGIVLFVWLAGYSIAALNAPPPKKGPKKKPKAKTEVKKPLNYYTMPICKKPLLAVYDSAKGGYVIPEPTDFICGALVKTPPTRKAPAKWVVVDEQGKQNKSIQIRN